MKFESQEIQRYKLDVQRQAEQKRAFVDKKKRLEDELQAMETDSKRLVEERDTDALVSLAKEIEEKKKEIEAVSSVMGGIKGADSIDKDVFLKEWRDYKQEYDRTKLQPVMEKIIATRQELEEALQKYGDLVDGYRIERDYYNHTYFGADLQTKYDMGNFHISSDFLRKHGLATLQMESLTLRTIGHVM